MGSVANHLKMADRQRIHALLELGWSHRRVAREAGVDRETVARYARAGPSNPANPIVGEKPSISGPRSPAGDHDDFIRQGVKAGLSAQRIWQDLVEQYGYAHGYLTVQRYVKRLKRRGEVADHTGTGGTGRLLQEPGAGLGRAQWPVAAAVGVPDDAVVFQARVRGGGLGPGSGQLPARARARVHRVRRGAARRPPRLCGAPHNRGSVSERVMWPAGSVSTSPRFEIGRPRLKSGT